MRVDYLEYDPNALYQLVIRKDPQPKRPYLPDGKDPDLYLLKVTIKLIGDSKHDPSDKQLVEWLTGELSQVLGFVNMTARIDSVLRNSTLLDYMRNFVMKDDLNDFARRDHVQEAVNYFVGRLNNLENAVANNTADISTLNEGFGGLQLDVAENTAEISTLRKSLSGLESLVGTALVHYSMCWEYIHVVQRKDDCKPSDITLIENILRSLDQIKPCVENDGWGVAFRGIDCSKMPEVYQGLHQKGYQYTDKAFTSASLDIDKAWEFVGNQYPVLLQICHKSGRFIQDHVADGRPDYEEVLFKPNAKFIVDNFEVSYWEGKRYLHVWLTEL